jgi:hypothetical protein
LPFKREWKESDVLAVAQNYFNDAWFSAVEPPDQEFKRDKLQCDYFNIVGEFNCAGLDTYGLTKISGRLKQGTPKQRRH